LNVLFFHSSPQISAFRAKLRQTHFHEIDFVGASRQDFFFGIQVGSFGIQLRQPWPLVTLIVTLECGPLTVKLSSSSLSGCFREKKANFDPKNHFFDIFKFDSLPASVSLCLFLSTVLPRRQK
jgi:hypothetical protein